MILYFDNLIIEAPLYADVNNGVDKVRDGKSEIYRRQSRFDVALYTLESYTVIDWSAVIIKYSLQDESKAEYFESRVKRLFPKAIIIRGRSDTQAKFQQSYELLKSLGDEWIWYAGNADHVFVAPNKDTLEGCLRMAKEMRKTHKFVSVFYTGFPEFRGLINPESLFYRQGLDILESNRYCDAVNFPNGNFDAVQIVHIDLFHHWFFSKDLTGKKIRVFRSDEVSHDVVVANQVIIIPRQELCSHFDGWGHLVRYGYENVDNLFPPLFIPTGFFEGKMKVAVGYDEYRKGWVNINSSKPDLSFKSSTGTDLRSSKLPLFWKGRIETLDLNPQYSEKEIEFAIPYPRSAYTLARQKTMRYIWNVRNYPVMILKRIGRWKDNPEFLAKTVEEGGSPLKIRIKKVIYNGIMLGYRMGVFK